MPSRTPPPDLPVLSPEAAAVTSPALPELRLVTVPDTAPPYDCDAHGTACPAGADLAGMDPAGARWAREPASGRPAVPPAAPDPGSASGPGSVAAAGSAAAAASAWPRQFAQAVVEVLAGARSPRQIVPCTTDRVRAHIAALTPLVAGERPARIQRILTSQPAAHAVEMTVVVNFGPRARALAIRCEKLPARPAAPGRPGRSARWLCTELEAG